ncbi:ABC transporter substrate-binding protein [Sanguibacter keddieii]|uniref:ABC transporter substrate-binding protein n=1 Tax=Sanguibacter keddieii TaxID=60920 RepID=UPI0009D694E1|nr:ABC transporter substrate-binding protein [Sanguibacter keddieii]
MRRPHARATTGPTVSAAGRATRRARTAVAGALAVVLLTAGCSSGDADAGGKTVIDFTWWGDVSRAERYEEAVAVFEKENPDIDVRTSYGAWDSYWSSRNVEAASGNLPDVMQMDIAYVTEYGSTGRLAPLDEHIGSTIDVSTLPDTLLPTGQIDGTTVAIPTSTATLATMVNTDLFTELGVDVPTEPLTWDEYDTLLGDLATAGASGDPTVYGSVDYTQIFWLFQIWLGQQGKTMFDGDALGFDESDLATWWERAQPLHADGTFMPPARLTQLEGVDALGIGETASEISWDNFLVRFSEGSRSGTLELLQPPADDPDQSGLFLKPSLLLSVGANTEHPEESAKLVDFLTNSPEVGEIFGMSRGVPSSSSAIEGFEPEGLDLQILEYEQSLEPYLTSSPPPPVSGFGTLESTFVRLSEELGYGTMTVDQAVEQWFAEAESVLAS